MGPQYESEGAVLRRTEGDDHVDGIIGALNEHETNIAYLREAIDTLRERLDPVLRPAEPGELATVQRDRPSRAPVTERITDLTTTLAQLRESIIILGHRIDI